MTEFAKDTSSVVVCEVPRFLAEYGKVTSGIAKPLEIGKTLLASSDWLIRCSFVSSLSSIFEIQRPAFLVVALEALGEQEKEVQIAAAEQLPFLAKLTGIDKAHLMTIFSSCVGASCIQVKIVTSKALLSFSDILPPEAIANALLALAGDDNPQSKITAIETFQSSGIPSSARVRCINAAVNSPCEKWRVRECLAAVITQIYTPELNPVIVSLVFDDACAVRKAILSRLPELTKKDETRKTVLLRKAGERLSGDDYQVRQAAILALIKSGIAVSENGLRAHQKAAQDSVPNVRLSLALNLPKSSEFNPVRAIFAQDSDPNVRDAIL
jgi:HEAT repeat protein